MEDIYIGVDGGATKSKVRVEKSDGTLLGVAIGGPANITRMPVEKAWDAIYAALNEVLEPHNISLANKNYKFHIGLGLAGCELPDVRADYLNQSHSFTTIKLTSDAHVACLGAHNGADGEIIIIGTGVVGYQIQGDVDNRVSGWGFPHDDEGGGAWLGLEAARLTFQSLDHRITASPLLEDVFAFFENDLNQFVTWANRASSSEFGRLAPLVIKHSQQGDDLAIQLMKKAALAVDLVGSALMKTQKQKNKSLPCALFGGIAPFVEPWLSAELRARLVPRKGDANVGAILMIKQVMRKDCSPD
ncbi:MAG: BadF/BadG/BcrA/BcrD ATPase family protein [Gammaproteobacteria bacterium]|nr:BadF/BadG/BcrA/BcrD ATPase family protein [Gammaproteobacteria bacterium]